jgi:hypothetical protein
VRGEARRTSRMTARSGSAQNAVHHGITTPPGESAAIRRPVSRQERGLAQSSEGIADGGAGTSPASKRLGSSHLG